MKRIVLTLLLIQFTLIGFSQEKVIGIIPIKHSITNGDASKAKTLIDINPKFPTSWIREYISTEISVICNGETLTAKGTDFALNEEQQRILTIAETGTNIKVLVNYYPENDLAKEVKEFDFTFLVLPDVEAEYNGGKTALQQYLKENILSKLSEITDSDIFQARVRFDIDESGAVCNVHQIETSHSPEVNKLILKTIISMPKWTPAKNADGTIAIQISEFILTGDLCLYGYLSENDDAINKK